MYVCINISSVQEFTEGKLDPSTMFHRINDEWTEQKRVLASVPALAAAAATVLAKSSGVRL